MGGKTAAPSVSSLNDGEDIRSAPNGKQSGTSRNNNNNSTSNVRLIDLLKACRPVNRTGSREEEEEEEQQEEEEKEAAWIALSLKVSIFYKMFFTSLLYI